MTARVRLLAATVLLFGWLAALGYSAATKDRGPVVSRAQFAVATRVVFATVEADADGRPKPTATVVEVRTPAGPERGEIAVANLPEASGFTGPGEYLLLLTQSGAGPYRIAGQPRSPGYEVPAEKLFIYPRSVGVNAQVDALLR